MMKLFPSFEDKNIQLKHDILTSYALFLFVQSIFIGYSTFNVGPDKSLFISTTLTSLIIPILVIVFARRNYKLVSILFVTTIWCTSSAILLLFRSDNSGMAYILADLFIKAALASLVIRWYSGVYMGIATILLGVLDRIFEDNQILNFLSIEPIPPMAYLIGFCIMLGTLGIIAIANALSFEKIFFAYYAEFRKRINAENLLIEQNQLLDQKVKIRTKEIETLNEELNATNHNLFQLNKELTQTNTDLYDQRKELETALGKLQETQGQLIHSEKMASLGILAAGVAHEINNPLNFISAGIYSLENYINDNLHGNESELAQILNALQTGLNRVASIVTSLNNYSRKDDFLISKCNIHSIIDSCLLMLQNQTKFRIEIIKNYNSQALMVNCNEGKMHQAILNILANAVQAIEDKGSISIETRLEKEILYISIKDTGCGISAEHMPKIFDPFFTTKDPGKGTGLGLSITYNILKEHHAKIEYESSPGKGTIVVVKLPVNHL